MQDPMKTLGQLSSGVQAALSILSASKSLFGQAQQAGIPVPLDARVKSLEDATQLLAEHVADIKADDQDDDKTVALLIEGVRSLEKDVSTALNTLRADIGAIGLRLADLEKAAAKPAAKPKASTKATTKAS